MSSTASISRRAFLGGGKERPAALRPPWSVDDFAVRCTGCGACADACPESVIAIAPDGLARLSFESGGCTFCGACETACEPRAIDRERAAAPFRHRVRITGLCLTERGIVCESCRDACPERAIRVRPSGRGVLRPGIDAALCTGCGLCVEPCPAGAMEIVRGATAPAAGGRA